LIEGGDLSQLDKASLQCRIVSILQFCFENGEVDFTGKIYQHYLGVPSAVAAWLAPEDLLHDLAQGLIYAPGNVIFFAKLSPWKETLPSHLRQLLKAQIPHLLQSALRAANTIGGFAVVTLRTILHESDSMSLASFRDLVEQACLLLSSPGQMLDICLEVLDGASELLLNESSPAREYFTRSVFGVALDHSEEASEATAPHQDLWEFQPVSLSLNPPVLTSYRRIDAPQLERLAAGDHVRFELARYPDNMFLVELPTFDALVESAQQGLVTFRCTSYPPAFCASARWRMRHCGSFVTCKAMLDALVALVERKQDSCVLYPLLMENKSPPEYLPLGPTYDFREDLNECQNRAVAAALTSRLSCIWGPPGTGKTQTVAIILQELLQRRPEERVLVTAPTHNAVDNILKRYLSITGLNGAKPLRVSTNVSLSSILGEFI
jgi:regulator of nonsense transcripts 1